MPSPPPPRCHYSCSWQRGGSPQGSQTGLQDAFILVGVGAGSSRDEEMTITNIPIFTARGMSCTSYVVLLNELFESKSYSDEAQIRRDSNVSSHLSNSEFSIFFGSMPKSYAVFLSHRGH